MEREIIRSIDEKCKIVFSFKHFQFGIIRLDGRTRFNLTDDQKADDLLSEAKSIHGILFRDKMLLNELRTYIFDGINLNIVVDPTDLGNFRYRLTPERPSEYEFSLSMEARAFYENAIHIKSASDGVQAYVGILIAAVSGNFHTILLDEPEAFLHPPLAKKLGRQLADLMTLRNISLITATHSADFLMGCVQNASPVRIVRLGYQNGTSSGKLIDQSQLRELLHRPLMRSANAISALFYDGAIITESDNDRCFYQEVYNRISAQNPSFPSIIFLNAQNKHTLMEIMHPLRAFGVPTTAIVDIDVFKDDGPYWGKFISAAGVPQEEHHRYHRERKHIDDKFKEATRRGFDPKKYGGINVLDENAKNKACVFIDELNSYGIFPVRRGELEHWLPALGVAGNKTKWTIDMLNALGGDPASPTYVKPGTDDVWAFLTEIIAWIENPNRKGIA